MKKTFLVLLALVLVGGMVFAGGAQQASGGGTPAAQTKLIYVLMQGSTSNFPRWQTASMKNYMDTVKPAGIEVRIVFADDDITKQMTQMDTALSEKADVIILNPIDKVQDATLVDKAHAAGVPVVTLSQETNSKNETAFVGSDDFESGTLQLERLYKVCGPGMRLAWINAAPGHSARILREQAYKAFVEKHPDIVVVATDQAPNWLADEALKVTEVWLQKFTGADSIQAIAAHADCILTGTVTAVEQAGLAGKIQLSGIDCDRNILEKIKQGVVDDSVWQDALVQGETALKTAIDLANGKTVDKRILVPFQTVTKDNVDEYMKKADERDALAKKYF
jgi:ABC-type sugar transport system substrate-binding protein